MGKSTRIVLLSVTVVLAIAVFLILWSVRPGVDNELLDTARSSESEGLISVTQADSAELAAMLASDESFIAAVSQSIAANIQVEAPSQEAVDTDSVIRTYIEEHRDEINAMFEASLDDDDVVRVIETYLDDNWNEVVNTIQENATLDTEAVRSVLDKYVEERLPELQALIAEAIGSYVNDNLDEGVAIVDQRIQDYVDNNIDTLSQIISSQIQAYVDANAEAGIGIIDQRIQAYVDDNMEALSQVIAGQIQSYVDENLTVLDQMIDEHINNYVAENEDLLLAIIRDEVSKGGIDTDAIVDSVTASIMSEVESRIADALTSIDVDDLIAMISSSIEDFSASIVDEAVSQANAYSDNLAEEGRAYAEDLVAQGQDYVDDAVRGLIDAADAEEIARDVMASYEDEIREGVNAQVEEVVEELGRTPITVPDLSRSPSASDEDYSAVRESERQAAIDSVLAFLQD